MTDGFALGLAALLLPLLLVASARAEPAGASRSERRTGAAQKKQAAAHYLQGKAFHKAGAYQRAIGEYQAAYALVPRPELVFNIGLAHQELGALEEALAHFQKYLELEPHGRAAADARAYVAALTVKLEEQAARRKQEAEAAAARQRARAAEQARAERARAEASARKRHAAVVAARSAAAQQRGRRLRRAGLATAVAGALSLGVGLKFGLDARGAAEAISGHRSGAWTDDLVDRSESGERAELLAVILGGVGGTALAAGGALYYWGARLDRSAAAELRVAVTPVIGAARAGLLLRADF